MPQSKNHHGFTLLEFLMVILLVGIVGALSVTTLMTGSQDQRFQATLDEMLEIRNAMVGDPEVQQNGIRSDFGYLGDLGQIPSVAQGGISALLTQPAAPVAAWAHDSTAKIGAGWRGSYLKGGPGTNYLTDAWGNAYVYAPAASPPTLTSYGADGASGGSGFNQDITVQMGTRVRTADVYGVILNYGAQWNQAAQVTIYYPDGNGTLTQATDSVAIGENGLFSFSNIPLGVRSAKIVVTSTGDTIGPFVFTVDQNKYFIPTSITDVNPSGGTGSTWSTYTAPTAPTVVGGAPVTTTASGNNDVITCNNPAGVQNGDLVIAVHGTERGSSLTLTANPTPQALAGFTSVLYTNTSTMGAKIRVQYRVASGEPASYNFRAAATGTTKYRQACAIVVLRGVKTGSPIASQFNASGTSTSPTAPTASVGTQKSILMRTFIADGTSIPSPAVYPTGDTGLFLLSAIPNISIGGSYSETSAIGPSATGAFTLTASSAWVALSLVVIPAE